MIEEERIVKWARAALDKPNATVVVIQQEQLHMPWAHKVLLLVDGVGVQAMITDYAAISEFYRSMTESERERISTTPGDPMETMATIYRERHCGCEKSDKRLT